MRYTIVELTEIPREKDKLKAVIGTARYEMRKAKFTRITAYVIIGIALLVLAFGACSVAPQQIAEPWTIYLPLIAR